MISRGKLALLFELVGNGATFTGATEYLFPEHLDGSYRFVNELQDELDEFCLLTNQSITQGNYHLASFEYAQWLRDGHHRLQPTWAWNNR